MNILENPTMFVAGLFFRQSTMAFESRVGQPSSSAILAAFSLTFSAIAQGHSALPLADIADLNRPVKTKREKIII